MTHTERTRSPRFGDRAYVQQWVIRDEAAGSGR